MTATESPSPKKICTICRHENPLDQLFCPECKNYYNHKFCDSCGQPIPFDAIRCMHCDSGQGFRRFLKIPETTLSMLTALVAVFSLVFTQVSNYVHRNSETSVSFVSADTDFIYVDVLNSGRSSSILHTARVKFGNLQIADEILLPAGDDKTVIRKIVPANSESRLMFQAAGLVRRPPHAGEVPMLRDDVLATANTAEVILEIEVQESTGPIVKRTDKLSGFAIRKLLQNKLARWPS